MKPIIFLDLETTGLDIQNDRIVELSLVRVEFSPVDHVKNGAPVTKTMRFNPMIPIPESASEIHGIYDKDVAELKPFKSYAKSIHEQLQGCDIAGFNSNYFDLPLLRNEFARSGITWDYSQHNLIDVGNLYKIFNPRTLSAAFRQYYGIDYEGKHSAEEDAIATMRVFEKMIDTIPDLTWDSKELALKSNYDKPILDLSGKFTYDKEGDIVFNFGQYKDKKAKDNESYLHWMIKANFPDDTLAICYKVLELI